jgi:hypothetical protein
MKDGCEKQFGSLHIRQFVKCRSFCQTPADHLGMSIYVIFTVKDRVLVCILHIFKPGRREKLSDPVPVDRLCRRAGYTVFNLA